MSVFLKYKEGVDYCGDRYLLLQRADSTLYVMIDGIGHGKEASAVADTACHSINASGDAPLIDIIRNCELALLGSRGIVISFVMWAWGENTLHYYSVGNIESVLISSDNLIHLKTHPGIFGSKNLPIHIASTLISAEAQLLMFTDGIGKLTGQIRHQLRRMNSRHIVQMLSKQWQGQDDVCIFCEKLHYELH